MLVGQVSGVIILLTQIALTVFSLEHRGDGLSVVGWVADVLWLKSVRLIPILGPGFAHHLPDPKVCMLACYGQHTYDHLARLFPVD